MDEWIGWVNLYGYGLRLKMGGECVPKTPGLAEMVQNGPPFEKFNIS